MAYEHKIETIVVDSLIPATMIRAEIERQLNAMTADGWEVVDVHKSNTTLGYEVVLKRKINDTLEK